MITKMVEILDRATCISAIAIKAASEDPIERFHFRRCGFGEDFPLIILLTLDPVRVQYGPYNWDTSSRTMRAAHQYIEDNFDNLLPGAVVDVEYILGETKEPKTSERIR